MKRCLPLLLLLSFFTLQLARAENTENPTFTAESFYNDPEIIGRYNQLSPEQQQKFLEGYPFLTHHRLVHAVSFISYLVVGPAFIFLGIMIWHYKQSINEISKQIAAIRNTNNIFDMVDFTQTTNALVQKRDKLLYPLLMALGGFLIAAIGIRLIFWFYKNYFSVGHEKSEEILYVWGGIFFGLLYLFNLVRADSFLRTSRIRKMKELLDKLEKNRENEGAAR